MLMETKKAQQVTSYCSRLSGNHWAWKRAQARARLRVSGQARPILPWTSIEARAPTRTCSHPVAALTGAGGPGWAGRPVVPGAAHTQSQGLAQNKPAVKIDQTDGGTDLQKVHSRSEAELKCEHGQVAGPRSSVNAFALALKHKPYTSNCSSPDALTTLNSEPRKLQSLVWRWLVQRHNGWHQLQPQKCFSQDPKLIGVPSFQAPMTIFSEAGCPLQPHSLPRAPTRHTELCPKHLLEIKICCHYIISCNSR